MRRSETSFGSSLPKKKQRTYRQARKTGPTNQRARNVSYETNQRSARRLFMHLNSRQCAVTMCSQCQEIDAKIKRLRDITTRLLDEPTLEGIAVLVADLVFLAGSLHPLGVAAGARVHFCTFLFGTIPIFPRGVLGRTKASRGGSAMAHRNARDLDAAHNSAIRKEIGYRLRAELLREPISQPPHIQDLLNRLTASEDAKGGTKNGDGDT